MHGMRASPLPILWWSRAGLETRRELSQKLNVSARQVQVWFQNKRQRERKLSRAKGLLSTPGLPDTPAVAAAHAKLAASGGTVGALGKEGQPPTGGVGGAAAAASSGGGGGAAPAGGSLELPPLQSMGAGGADEGVGGAAGADGGIGAAGASQVAPVPVAEQVAACRAGAGGVWASEGLAVAPPPTQSAGSAAAAAAAPP